MNRCPGCRMFSTKAVRCERCEWLAAIGTLVSSIAWRPLGVLWCDALDAVAYLLTERAVTRRRHQRELREEQQFLQRQATDAYTDGLHEGRQDAGGGW